MDAVDELDGSGVGVLCKERNRHVARPDTLQHVTDRPVHEQCILNFVLGLLAGLSP